MRPQGIEGFESYCWDTFLDADFQRWGPNGEKHLEILSVPVLSPYKPNKMVKNKRTQFSPLWPSSPY